MKIQCESKLVEHKNKHYVDIVQISTKRAKYAEVIWSKERGQNTSHHSVTINTEYRSFQSYLLNGVRLTIAEDPRLTVAYDPTLSPCPIQNAKISQNHKKMRGNPSCLSSRCDKKSTQEAPTKRSSTLHSPTTKATVPMTIPPTISSLWIPSSCKWSRFETGQSSHKPTSIPTMCCGTWCEAIATGSGWSEVHWPINGECIVLISFVTDIPWKLREILSSTFWKLESSLEPCIANACGGCSCPSNLCSPFHCSDSKCIPNRSI